MTLARMFGGPAIERWGRVAVLRVTAGVGAVGLLLVVTRLSVPMALTGAVLWGVGASLGFPIGMSSAADDPARAAVNVSVAGAIGYGAFLAGPPLIGFLAHRRRAACDPVRVRRAGRRRTASGAARPLPATARIREKVADERARASGRSITMWCEASSSSRYGTAARPRRGGRLIGEKRGSAVHLRERLLLRRVPGRQHEQHGHASRRTPRPGRRRR
jgi:hypothetical protein